VATAEQLRGGDMGLRLDPRTKMLMVVTIGAVLTAGDTAA
jgi:hypothetical protein